MSPLGTLLILLGRLAHLAIGLFEVLIIFRVLMSWIRIDLPLNRLTRLFYAVTEALLRPVRMVLPTFMGGWDLTPLFALAALYAVDRWLVGSLILAGYQLLR